MSAVGISFLLVSVVSIILICQGVPLKHDETSEYLSDNDSIPESMNSSPEARSLVSLPPGKESSSTADYISESSSVSQSPPVQTSTSKKSSNTESSSVVSIDQSNVSPVQSTIGPEKSSIISEESSPEHSSDGNSQSSTATYQNRVSSDQSSDSPYQVPEIQNDDQANATKSNATNIVIVIDEGVGSKSDGNAVEIQNTDTKNMDEQDIRSLVQVKTIRVNKVEEVFEDLLAQKIHRIITEDRIEQTQLSDRNLFDERGAELSIKALNSA